MVEGINEFVVLCAYKVQKIDKPVEKNMKYKPIEAGRKLFRKTSAQRNSP